MSVAPVVVNLRVDEYDVYIGRGSPWGNPFVIGRDGSREQVIEKYEAWLMEQPELILALPDLRGKVLGCYCAPKACHGDVLARLAAGFTMPGEMPLPLRPCPPREFGQR